MAFFNKFLPGKRIVEIMVKSSECRSTAGASKKRDGPPSNCQGAPQACTTPHVERKAKHLLRENWALQAGPNMPNGYGQYPGPFPSAGGRVGENLEREAAAESCSSGKGFPGALPGKGFQKGPGGFAHGMPPGPSPNNAGMGYEMGYQTYQVAVHTSVGPGARPAE